MWLSIHCMTCLKERNEPSEQIARVEFRDDSRYELTCPAGHVTTTLLQQQKFEILFEIGAYAVSDGYYREAVSSFTSALERFYEFVVRVLLENWCKTDDVFQECWKVAAKQSERQLGAFVFLWAATFGRKPHLLPTKRVEFRNEVIHKGRIPSRPEAIEYGNAVLEVLRPLMLELKGRFEEEVRKVTFYHLRDSSSEADRGKPVATMSIGTLVSLVAEAPSDRGRPLEDYISQLDAKMRSRQSRGRGRKNA